MVAHKMIQIIIMCCLKFNLGISIYRILCYLMFKDSKHLLTTIELHRIL